ADLVVRLQVAVEIEAAEPLARAHLLKPDLTSEPLRRRLGREALFRWQRLVAQERALLWQRPQQPGFADKTTRTIEVRGAGEIAAKGEQAPEVPGRLRAHQRALRPTCDPFETLPLARGVVVREPVTPREVGDQPLKGPPFL